MAALAAPWAQGGPSSLSLESWPHPLLHLVKPRNSGRAPGGRSGKSGHGRQYPVWPCDGPLPGRPAGRGVELPGRAPPRLGPAGLAPTLCQSPRHHQGPCGRPGPHRLCPATATCWELCFRPDSGARTRSLGSFWSSRVSDPYSSGFRGTPVDVTTVLCTRHPPPRGAQTRRPSRAERCQQVPEGPRCSGGGGVGATRAGKPEGLPVGSGPALFQEPHTWPPHLPSRAAHPGAPGSKKPFTLLLARTRTATRASGVPSPGPGDPTPRGCPSPPAASSRHPHTGHLCLPTRCHPCRTSRTDRHPGEMSRGQGVRPGR